MADNWLTNAHNKIAEARRRENEFWQNYKGDPDNPPDDLYEQLQRHMEGTDGHVKDQDSSQ